MWLTSAYNGVGHRLIARVILTRVASFATVRKRRSRCDALTSPVPFDQAMEHVHVAVGETRFFRRDHDVGPVQFLVTACGDVQRHDLVEVVKLVLDS